MNREDMTRCMRDGCTIKQVHEINDYIDQLQQENDQLKSMLNIGKTCGFCPYYRAKEEKEKLIKYLEDRINHHKNKQISYLMDKQSYDRNEIQLEAYQDILERLTNNE